MDFREAFELRAVLREGVDLVEQAGCLLGNREGVDAVRLEVAGDALDVAVEEVVEVDDLVLVDAALDVVPSESRAEAEVFQLLRRGRLVSAVEVVEFLDFRFHGNPLLSFSRARARCPSRGHPSRLP